MVYPASGGQLGGVIEEEMGISTAKSRRVLLRMERYLAFEGGLGRWPRGICRSCRRSGTRRGQMRSLCVWFELLLRPPPPPRSSRPRTSFSSFARISTPFHTTPSIERRKPENLPEASRSPLDASKALRRDPGRGCKRRRQQGEVLPCAGASSGGETMETHPIRQGVWSRGQGWRGMRWWRR